MVPHIKHGCCLPAQERLSGELRAALRYGPKGSFLGEKYMAAGKRGLKFLATVDFFNFHVFCSSTSREASVGLVSLGTQFRHLAGSGEP